MNRNFTAQINICGCHRCHSHRAWLLRANEMLRAIHYKVEKGAIDKLTYESERARINYVDSLGEVRDPMTRLGDCIH